MVYDQQGRDVMGQSKKAMHLDAVEMAHDNINEGVEVLEGMGV
jgi:hypothetical protein